MERETIVAIYDDVLSIEAACAELTAAGIQEDAISWTGAPVGSTSTHAAPARERGFWSSLFGGEPDHDTIVYDRCIESGSHMLTVRAAHEHVAQVIAILERHDPVDIEARGASYGASSDTDDTIYGSGEAIVPLSEEQMSVGKRLVDRGTTRVRRFVVATPVTENVTLHAERAVVERRPASGASATPAFTDQQVEMQETDEEAVIGKSSYVAEDIVVRRVANDHVETIHDTLRHEDIEITHDDPAPTI